MSDLRDILIQYQYEVVLKKHFGDDYYTVSDDEKKGIITLIEKSVALDVDSMLSEYVNYVKATSPVTKNNKLTEIVLAIINILLTIGLAYSVNEEAWVFVTLFGLINLITFIAPIFMKK